MEKNQLSIEQKKVTEEEIDEEEGQQIDDQEEILVIDQVILEEHDLLMVQAIQKENFEIDLHIQEEMVISRLTLEKNSEIKKRLHQKKILEQHPRMWRKKVIDQKESLDPKKTSELHPRMWVKKISELKRASEITHREKVSKNKTTNHYD
jgi:hypothetical protein